jgi:hypothetical protein
LVGPGRVSATVNVIDLTFTFSPERAVAFRPARHDQIHDVRIADNIKRALRKCRAD